VEYPLMYEDIESSAPLLVNDMMEYECEYSDCESVAIVEWVSDEEDGKYFTYRCIEHPVTSLDYKANII
jgi:hypothetical protein